MRRTVNTAGDRPAGRREPPRRALTLRAHLEAHRLAEPVVSPDGARVLVVGTRADFAKNRVDTQLYEADPATRKHRALTAADQASFAPAFSFDGERILFLRKPSADAPAEIFALPARGGEPARITTTRFGVAAYRPLPDGTIRYLRREQIAEGSLEAARRAAKAGEDARLHNVAPRPFDYVRIDGAGKETVPARLDPGTAGLPVERGDRLYTVTTEDGRFDAWRTYIKEYDIKKNRWRRVTDGERRFFRVLPHPDGRRLLALGARSDIHSCTARTLFLVDPATGRLTDLLPDLDREIERFRLARDGRSARFTVACGTRRRLFAIDLVAGRTDEIPVRGVAADVAGDPCAGDTFAVLEDAASPQELVRLTPAGRRRGATAFNAALGTVARAKQEAVRFRSPDGAPLEAILVHPLRRPKRGRPPLLVSVHGGPYAHAVNTFLNGQFTQYFAALGYAMVLPNYRGSMGYGSEFSTASVRDLGGGDFADVMAATDLALRRLSADPDRLGILGGSYGGYMVNRVVTRTDRFRAAVSRYGIFSLATDFLNTELPGWERMYLNRFPWEDPDAYARMSPATDAERIRTPLLITHGEADANTAPVNSRELYRTLRAMKRPARFVTYPREGHGYDEPRHRVDECRRIAAWFGELLVAGRRFRTHDEMTERRRFLGPHEVADLRLEPREPPPGFPAGGLCAALHLALDLKPGRPAAFRPLSARSLPVTVALASGRRIRPVGIMLGGHHAAGAPVIHAGSETRGGTLALELLFHLPDDDPAVTVHIGPEQFPVAI